MKTSPQSSQPHTITIQAEVTHQQERAIKALADVHRLQILRLLKQQGGTITVAEIVEKFDLEQPTISHHLRVLRDAGLVDCRKKGLYAYYFTDAEKLAEVYMWIRDLVPPEVKPSKRSA